MQGFNMGRYVPPSLLDAGITNPNHASGKSHALGSRASKLKTEGKLTVRFEMPFTIWCTNCTPEAIIAQGVRFNAEKKQVDKYFSTPVWEFRIKHTVCGKGILITTDPARGEYIVGEGGRRRDYGQREEGELGFEERKEEEQGGFEKLEKKQEEKAEVSEQQRRVEELRKRQERDWADPYERNRKVRREFRVGRRMRQKEEKSGEALKERFGLGLDVLGSSEEDGRRAALVGFGTRGKRDSIEPKSRLQVTLQRTTRNVADPFAVQRSEPSVQAVMRHTAHEDHATSKMSVNEEKVDEIMDTKAALVEYDSD